MATRNTRLTLRDFRRLTNLPGEIRNNISGFLNPEDIHALSQVNQDGRAAFGGNAYLVAPQVCDEGLGRDDNHCPFHPENPFRHQLIPNTNQHRTHPSYGNHNQHHCIKNCKRPPNVACRVPGLAMGYLQTDFLQDPHHTVCTYCAPQAKRGRHPYDSPNNRALDEPIIQAMVEYMVPLCDFCIRRFTTQPPARRDRIQPSPRIRQGICNCLHDYLKPAMCRPCKFAAAAVLPTFDYATAPAALRAAIRDKIPLVAPRPPFLGALNFYEGFACICGRVQKNPTPNAISGTSDLTGNMRNYFVCMRCDQICSVRVTMDSARAHTHRLRDWQPRRTCEWILGTSYWNGPDERTVVVKNHGSWNTPVFPPPRCLREEGEGDVYWVPGARCELDVGNEIPARR